MTSERFYAGEAADLAAGDEFQLSPAEAHHAVHVLRLKRGAKVRVFGRGHEFQGEISAADRSKVVVQLHEEVRVRLLPRIMVHSCIPWLKGGRTEPVVQKLTELGAAAVTIYEPRRAVARAGPEVIVRLQRVAIAAAKQCGRASVPTIDYHHSLSEAFSSAPANFVRVVAYEAANDAELLSHVIASAIAAGGANETGVAVGSGPEGGFDPDEIEQLCAVARIVSLGKLILRADTAPIAAMVACLCAAGEL